MGSDFLLFCIPRTGNIHILPFPGPWQTFHISSDPNRTTMG